MKGDTKKAETSNLKGLYIFLIIKFRCADNDIDRENCIITVVKRIKDHHF